MQQLTTAYVYQLKATVSMGLIQTLFFNINDFRIITAYTETN